MRTELESFVEEVTALPKIHRAYIAEPKQKAPHFKEMDWTILEIHVVPNDRPPYIELEKFFRLYPMIWEGISELSLLKVGDVYLVRILEPICRSG